MQDRTINAPVIRSGSDLELRRPRSVFEDRPSSTLGSDTSIAALDSNSELSTDGRCAFTGLISCSHVALQAVQVIVSLTNTSDPEGNGFLTAFMFRMPRELGGFTVSLLRSSQPGMSRIPPGTDGAPFLGTWQGGVGTGGEWQSGGTPMAGLAPGDTGAWAFLVSGVGSAGLTAKRLMSGGAMADPYAFVVRFRALGAGDSDKVPARMPDDQLMRMTALGEELELMS